MTSKVLLSHGSGGVETAELLRKLIFSKVPDELMRVNGGLGIDRPDDSALIPIGKDEFLVVSIDSYTVNPLFFPGGNIGVLAATGSINDVAVMGGVPIAMLDSIVVEEGFPLSDLEVITNSFLEVLRRENVSLIGGDFKVMPKGQLDKIVITTVGIGVTSKPIIDYPREGDKIIVSGYLGDHGAVILMSQIGMSTVDQSEKALTSDVRSVAGLMKRLNDKLWPHIHAARDPTRGGLAGVLNDWASISRTVIVVNEALIPVRSSTKYFAGMMGIDPLYLASEGAVVISVSPEYADEAVSIMRESGFENASIIGEVKRSAEYAGIVLIKSVVGGHRILEPPRGELVPRIC